MGVEKVKRPFIAPGFEDYQSPNSLGGGGGGGGGDSVPAEFVFIASKDDFPAAVGGVIALEAGYTYFIAAEVDLLGDRLVAGPNTTILGGSSENCILMSTGLTGTALITSEYSLPMRNFTIKADVGVDLQASDPSNNALDWFGLNFLDCPTVGYIKDYNNFIMSDCALLNSANMTFDGTIGTVGAINSLFSGRAGQTTVNFPSTFTASRRIRFAYTSFVAFGGATAIQLDPAASVANEGYILDTINFSGGATYTGGVNFISNKALFVNCRGVTNTSEIAQMTMIGNATATDITASATPTKAAGTTVFNDTVSQKFSMPASNRLQFDGGFSRDFKCTGIVTVIAGTNNQIGTYFAKNGTVLATSETYVTTDGGGRRENATFQTIVTLAPGDYIEVFVENNTTTADVTVENLSVIVEALN